ncbi:hypothetical protein [Arthrobacter sp. Bi26]|uniref:hypothetical protein n=1 Tax=Arthrobacter sp. Bi26 TaxID=2822350 RepID=UPI001E54BE90|nr:hypothetical protein [Arthrobacter sp. Bi26]
MSHMLARRGDPFRSLGCRFPLNRSENHGIGDTLLFNVQALVAEFEGASSEPAPGKG